MQSHSSSLVHLDPHTYAIYQEALGALAKAHVRFLLGGAYAFAAYTEIERHTKDCDVFVHPSDLSPTLDVLAAAGYRTDLTYPHWLGKAFKEDQFIDIIFSSGNGVARVDDEWFEHSIEREVLGLPVRLCPIEEMIWSKAYVQERERHDGADIAHLLRAHGARLDWARLLRRFGSHWRVLLGHLVLFGFIYPGEQPQVPLDVLQTLIDRLESEIRRPPSGDRTCQGTLLSRAQYLVDTEQWQYQDARLAPVGNMTAAELAIWTAAIGRD